MIREVIIGDRRLTVEWKHNLLGAAVEMSLMYGSERVVIPIEQGLRRPPQKRERRIAEVIEAIARYDRSTEAEVTQQIEQVIEDAVERVFVKHDRAVASGVAKRAQRFLETGGR